MATIDGRNTVYGGRAGSGRAFVLPANQAINIYASGLADQRERERLQEAALLKRNQDIADENAKTLGALKPADHWGARSAEIQNEYKDLNNYAMEAVQAGRNLNNDRDFIQKRNEILAKAGATKDLQTLYERNFNQIGSNPDSFENAQEVLSSIQNASLADYTSGKFRVPELRKKYSLSDAIEESGGTVSYVKNNDGTYDTTRVNRSGNVGQAIASIDTPAARYVIQKQGGDTGPYVGGFPTVTADGKTYFNTEGAALETAAINALATDANLPSYLQSKGYDISSTDSIRKSAIDFAKKQNKAAGNYVKSYADALENKATTDTTRVFAAESNQRARNAEARAQEDQVYQRGKRADEELAKNPDTIASNVITNIATTQTNGGKVVQRPSTSFAAANVGNAKTPFMPRTVYDSETGLASANSSPLTISGGQVHIKPVLNFNGTSKILDDQSLNQIREGKYKINGKLVPKNTPIQYDELLYGEERIPGKPNQFGISEPASVRKVVLPLTGQALDKKFDKAYDRTSMYETAVKAATNFDTKVDILKQYLKTQAPNLSDTELSKLAFETAKQY